MKIQITAVIRDGHLGVWTPQTRWLSAKPTTVEVLDQDESPPRAPGDAVDGMKIGRAELAQLRATQGLVVAGIDQTNAVEMTAQLAEAHAAHRQEMARLQGVIDQQAIEILRLKPFEARGVEQEQTIADLRARLATLTAPPTAATEKPAKQAQR